MPTPFDKVIDDIKQRGYHNHRLEEHSNELCEGIFQDLLNNCAHLKEDLDAGTVSHWLNVRTPGGRKRRIDMVIGEPEGAHSTYNPDRLRICIENKSVITAHRNRDARFDDLNESLQVIHNVKPDAIQIATVLVGVAERVLNVPDKIKPLYKDKMEVFDKKIAPRFSSGDQTLWKEFAWAVSNNRKDDPLRTVEKFQTLPKREIAQTHIVGYDYILLIPVFVDNVNPPYVARKNSLEINIDNDYKTMLQKICTAYSARWHM